VTNQQTNLGCLTNKITIGTDIKAKANRKEDKTRNDRIVKCDSVAKFERNQVVEQKHEEAATSRK